jgi:hypothetical protein
MAARYWSGIHKVPDTAKSLRSPSAEGAKEALLRNMLEPKPAGLNAAMALAGGLPGTSGILRNDDGGHATANKETLCLPYFADADGDRLEGTRRYRLRFALGLPVNSFYSLAIYELPANRLYACPSGHNLITLAMLPMLRCDDDGSVAFDIQHVSPGKDRETNWLPSPTGSFWTALRLYWPRPEVLDGCWETPALQRMR